MSITDPTLGEITMFGASWAPRGWALCQGQLLAISTNQALFSILGTIYGGDGRTTFGLPDFRSRLPKGQGNGPGLGNTVLGQKAGVENVSIGIQNMPSHSHPHTHTATVHSETRPANERSPGGNRFALAASNAYHDDDGTVPDQTMHENTVTLSTDSSNAGGNIPLNVENPYLGINFIIALTGTYPSRN